MKLAILAIRKNGCGRTLTCKAFFLLYIFIWTLLSKVSFYSMHTCRCILLLGRLYVHVPSADLPKIEFLKKAALELLNSSMYNKENLECVAGLYRIISNSLSMSSSKEFPLEDETGSCENAPNVLLPADSAVEVVDCLRRQLVEDIAMLRRISRVEDYCGIDCKAILQSG